MLYISMLYMRFWISSYVQMIEAWFTIISTQFVYPSEKELVFMLTFYLHSNGWGNFTFSVWSEKFPEKLFSPRELAPVPLWRTGTLGETNGLYTPQEWSAQGN